LLVRQAIPGFSGVAPSAELFCLAGREDVESKLFLRRGARWVVREGPLPRAAFARLPRMNWTLLVHGINFHVPAADRLLRKFDFIPYARLDDVLVSYAVDGGGVGPHFDSYDVFLIQGEGRRRWRISRQRDRTLDARAPHRMLANFRAQREWILEPGDMLYLPPGCAHEGSAMGTCTTYSVGFRAPSAQELGTAFLDYLRDNLRLEGMYADPDLEPQRHPAAMPAAMLPKLERMLAPIRPGRKDLKRFLGGYLSEPKPHIVFAPPDTPMSEARFRAAVLKRGARLDARTLMLFDATHVYINGERTGAPGRQQRILRVLADCRALHPGVRLPRMLCSRLYRWYLDGWLLIGTQDA
jgi:50S ribosomal protein L16 3-hydroxylase